MTTIVGLKGERVRLVPPDRALHLENAYRWINDPAVCAAIALNLGASRREEEAFFDRVEGPFVDQKCWAILDEGERHIGFIDLREINWRLRSATGGVMIGERDCWGRGHATDAVRLRTRFAFDLLGLHRIEGHTINPAMRRVYEKCGYRCEGTQRRKLWRDGRWWDVVLYAVLDEDFQACRSAWGPCFAPSDPSGQALSLSE